MQSRHPPITEDKLGLDAVCIQAKRWQGTVSRPTVQSFVGSMDLIRARKGVVITTSDFFRDAVESAVLGASRWRWSMAG